MSTRQAILKNSIIILCCLLWVQQIWAANFRKGPYLIYPETNTQMTILWQADSSPGASKVEWGADASYGSSNEPTEYGDNQFKYTITGLVPGNRYYYRVTVDSDVNAGSFLAASDENAASLTFYAYGDTRSNPNLHNNVCNQILSDINKVPDKRQTFILHSGDWVNKGGNESEWDNQFFDRSQSKTLEMMRSMPIMGCLGNHDWGNLFEKYWQYDWVTTIPEEQFCYSFDYGPVHVSVIQIEGDGATMSPAQQTWLDNDLLNTTKTWKAIVFHAPAWSAGGHENNVSAQNDCQPILENRGAQIVFNGHNHYYSRAMVNGIAHITAGGGGAPLYNPKLDMPNIVAAEKARHFCRIEITGFETVSTMVVTIIREDGTEIESFKFEEKLTKGDLE